MTRTLDFEGTRIHEAGHVAGSIMTGRMPAAVTADWPHLDTLGITTSDIERYPISVEVAHSHLIESFCGPLAQKRAGWPLPWPLDRKARTSDARQIALLADALELDEAEYREITDRAQEVAGSPDFHHIVGLVSRALEMRDPLDADDLGRLIPDRLLTKYGIETEATCST
jgi:hypothetical protein